MGNGGRPNPQRPQAALTAQMLAAATEEQRTHMIGERLYPLVEAQQPEHASKITGMLLEMDISDLLSLLESPDLLRERTSQAVEVLLQHRASK